ncbi:hypothetical protein L1887_37845 [Cichorium endivia]|nr:hypothetical protein L1887_37845 [Cichorium endivia]
MMQEAKSIDVPLATALEAFRQLYRVVEDPQEKMLLDWHLAYLEYANATLMSNLSMVFWDQDDPFEMGGEIDTFGHLSDKSSMRGEFFLFYSYSSVSGGQLLVALVAREAAIEFEKMSPVESVKRVMEILKGIFNPKGIAVPDPLQAICTRWCQDQFSYGSYSYVGIGASGNDYDILAENIGGSRVFFVGEATYE